MTRDQMDERESLLLLIRRWTLPIRSQWWRLQMKRGKCVTYAHVFPSYKGSGVPPKGTPCACGKSKWGVFPDGW